MTDLSMILLDTMSMKVIKIQEKVALNFQLTSNGGRPW